MKKLLNFTFACLAFLLIMACENDEPILSCEETINELQLNDIRVLGSHNSYRLKTPDPIMAFMKSQPELLPDNFDPGSWDYTHEPIYDQLNNYGIRSLELDVYRDPDGGLFYNRIGNAFVGMDIESKEPKLLEPGLKVLHFPDFDYESHYLTFKEALHSIKSWSSSHPTHLPITVLVEAKEDSPDAMLPGMGLTSTLQFKLDAVEEIEVEINEVFAGDMGHILRPDDVRKSYSTLRSAVTKDAWPTLGESRGKIIFVLMAHDAIYYNYTVGHPSLAGRNMFIFAEEWQDEAAYIKIDDPIANKSDIRHLINQGFIVRTQADSDTHEARIGDSYRKEMAFISAAQIICTDYYRPDPRASNSSDWTDYFVDFPNNSLALVNEYTGPTLDAGCEINE